MLFKGMEKYAGWAMLPVRLALASTFLYHGYGKLFGGVGGFAGILTQLDIPAPGFFAWVVAIVEFVGGLCILIGYLTREASIFIIINLIVAIWKVHWAHGFSVMHMSAEGQLLGIGYEPHLMWVAGLIALFILGPGKLSIEEALKKKGTTSSGS